MIYILSWTTKKRWKTLFRPLHSKLQKIQGLFKTVQSLDGTGTAKKKIPLGL